LLQELRRRRELRLPVSSWTSFSCQPFDGAPMRTLFVRRALRCDDRYLTAVFPRCSGAAKMLLRTLLGRWNDAVESFMRSVLLQVCSVSGVLDLSSPQWARVFTPSGEVGVPKVSCVAS